MGSRGGDRSDRNIGVKRKRKKLKVHSVFFKKKFFYCSAVDTGATMRIQEPWTPGIPNQSQCGEACLTHPRGPSSTKSTVGFAGVQPGRH